MALLAHAPLVLALADELAEPAAHAGLDRGRRDLEPKPFDRLAADLDQHQLDFDRSVLEPRQHPGIDRGLALVGLAHQRRELPAAPHRLDLLDRPGRRPRGAGRRCGRPGGPPSPTSPAAGRATPRGGSWRRLRARGSGTRSGSPGPATSARSRRAARSRGCRGPRARADRRPRAAASARRRRSAGPWTEYRIAAAGIDRR